MEARGKCWSKLSQIAISYLAFPQCHKPFFSLFMFNEVEDQPLSLMDMCSFSIQCPSPHPTPLFCGAGDQTQGLCILGMLSPLNYIGTPSPLLPQDSSQRNHPMCTEQKPNPSPPIKKDRNRFLENPKNQALAKNFLVKLVHMGYIHQSSEGSL